MGFVAMTEKSDTWRKIESIRSMQGLTQKSLAEKAGYSAVYVKDVLMGMRKSEAVQEKVARAIGFASWAELEQADVGVMM